MKRLPTTFRLFAFLGVFAAAALPAFGVLTVIIREVGDDVVLQHAGSLDVTGLTFDKAANNAALLHPQFGSLFSGAGNAERYFGEEPTVFPAFGPDRGEHPETFELADYGVGLPFGVGSGYVFVPSGYASNSHFSGTATYLGESLSSLQLTPGIYTAPLPNDLVILIVGASLTSGAPALPADPEPFPDPDPSVEPNPDPDSDPGTDPDPDADGGGGPASPPRGSVPNAYYSSSELYKRISPVMGSRHQNQPNIINGYLFLAGNAIHELWDISNPYSPVFLSEMQSPDRFGEAESHQVSFARYPDGAGYRLYAATTSGLGIDLWDITDATAPYLVGKIALTGVSYGDSTEAVWGIHWQGDYIYVGGTNTGLHIVDASDPSNPTLVNRLPNPKFGGMPAGPVYAVGNLLVITTPKNSSAIATMDISDPANPKLLDYENPEYNSYIGGYYGGRAYLLSPFRTYDVTSDPNNITLLGSDATPRSEYLSFDNGLLFLGSLSVSSGGIGGILKYDISDPNALLKLAHIKGRDNDFTDDQFSIPVGNLLVVSDDKRLRGSWIAVHDTEPDTTAPKVLHVNPANGATNVATTSRVALSFSDQIELASVDAGSFIVQPLGGQPLAGKWGYQQTLVTFWPDQPLAANTSYEIIVPTDGITDLVGNGLEAEFRATFSTGDVLEDAITESLSTAPVQVGHSVAFAPQNVDPSKYSYHWDFGDGSKGHGPTVEHVYQVEGRYPVVLTIREAGAAGEALRLEGENAAMSGGVVSAANNGGYSGSGFADYPFAFGSSVKLTWDLESDLANGQSLAVQYANGSGRDRPLNLYVNGAMVGTIDGAPTGDWSTWKRVEVPDVAFEAGANAIELVADADSIGPNVDFIEVTALSESTKTETRVVTQIVHRPLTESEPTGSSSILVDESGGRVWSVNPDANTVTAVSLANFTKALEVSVGVHPRSLAIAPSGEIWVVNQKSANVSILDAGTGNALGMIDLQPGSQPFGIAFAPDGSAAYVTLESTGRLLKIDPTSREVIDSVSFGPDASGIVPQVRAVAITGDSSRILVTRFISSDSGGELYDVSASNLASWTVIPLAKSAAPDTPDSGRGIPNYLSSLVISPDGVKAWAPSKQDNIDRGLYRDGLSLTHDNTVRPIVSRIDLSTGQEDSQARMDLNDSDMPFAAAASDLGDLVFVAVQGSNAIDVRNAYNGDSVAGFSTGLAPQGLAFDSQGRLYVQNFMSRSLSVFDVSAILDGSDNTAELLAEVDLVDSELLTSEVLLGKQIFYNANDPRMSFEGYLSCATCHLDGGQDGRIWDFTDRGEGFRNTISLLGRSGTGHGKLHWTANFDEVQDFENDMRLAFGGSGFLSVEAFESARDPLGAPKAGLSAELDALAAYVASLNETPDSPYRKSDGSLTEAGARGKVVFSAANCVACHSGPEFTDGLRHDVGTIQSNSGTGSGQPLAGVGFDTPSLKGLWNSAPYLHNGAAATLGDVLENASHGDVSGLSQSDIDDLVAYLLQIDDRE